MASGTSFFATAADEAMLLDYLGVPKEIQLFDWWGGPSAALTRPESMELQSIGILAPSMGDEHWLTPNDSGFKSDDLSGHMRQINWATNPGQPLLDVDTTPALFWTRGAITPPVLTPSRIGSQATALKHMGDEYRRWVNRVSAWIRRNGNAVWDCSDPRSPIARGDVHLNTVNTVYALRGR